MSTFTSFGRLYKRQRKLSYTHTFRKLKFFSMNYYFSDIDALYDRIQFAVEQRKNIIFVVGSPLTAPYGSNNGVLGVDAIVELIKKEFSKNSATLQSLEDSLRVSGQGSYQNSFQFLISRRGLDYANKIVRTAVAHAYNEVIECLDDVVQLDSSEKDVDNWTLTPAVASLGAILAGNKQSFSTVLTTNFDPLIQISIAKAGGNSFTTMLHREGNLHQTRADATHVVHLHGSWRGSDTLHTDAQLKQERPQLQSSLVSIARDSLIVVIGYGGWDDIVTTTLSKIVLDDTFYSEILWAFYSESPEDIKAQNEALLSKLKPGIDRGRVSLYSHVDCHEFFPKLQLTLFPSTSHQPECQEGGNLLVDEQQFVEIFDGGASQINPINALPKNDVWFGRKQETQKLENSKAKVIAITGIGGQGKSSLASNFFEKSQIDESFSFFDWKDCREQGNTLNLALCTIIHKASNAAIDISTISKRTVSELTSILINELNGRKAIIVFDNVDHYVDLETNSPLGALEAIVNVALSQSHQVIFVFTARPVLQVDSPDFLELRLLGLAEDDARELFSYRYNKELDKSKFKNLYAKTAGHPLWLSIIAAQCFATDRSIESTLDGFDGSYLVMPKNMLRQIWEKLNDNQKHVLRTLAELERPESEKNIEEITGLNYNRLSKALVKLRSMCLIERKVTQSQVDMIDLHPLIKKFVREEFPRKERESFIGKVILYLDRCIFGFKKKLNGPVPSSVLEMWIHKIDLQINSGAIAVATDSLIEIENVLDRNGFNDELVRLSKRIFIEMSWVEVSNEYGKFDLLFNASIRSMIELYSSNDVDFWLDRYEQAIAGKGAQYINLCDLHAYKHWFNRDYGDAILWAERGEALKGESNVDTDFNCAHTLALAQRDSGRSDLALLHFMDGLTEEEIFSTECTKNKNGPYFGNIGRCYYFLNHLQKSLKMYQRSAISLENGKSAVISQGYIRHWVGQSMILLNRREDAIYFLRAAAEKWARVAPSLASEVNAEIGKIVVEFPKLVEVVNSPNWKCENRFSQWTLEKI
jgi:tetratricopeptide (TPR) repeat protein